MNKKGYYSVQFKGYPDVVTLQEMAEMLGGVCLSTASRLLQTNRVNGFKIKNKWQIPKELYDRQAIQNPQNQYL